MAECVGPTLPSISLFFRCHLVLLKRITIHTREDLVLCKTRGKVKIDIYKALVSNMVFLTLCSQGWEFGRSPRPILSLLSLLLLQERSLGLRQAVHTLGQSRFSNLEPIILQGNGLWSFLPSTENNIETNETSCFYSQHTPSHWFKFSFLCLTLGGIFYIEIALRVTADLQLFSHSYRSQIDCDQKCFKTTILLMLSTWQIAHNMWENQTKL